MNREIKFRAWDSQALAMSNTFEPLKHEEPKVYDEYVNDAYAIYMQYTGIKDKNGKEIYEGDIVLHQMAEFHCEIIYKKSIAQFMAKEFFGKRKVWQISIKKDILVIGNIYENPELLK